MSLDKAKVTPEVLQSILLDEMTGKLASILSMMEREEPIYGVASVLVPVTAEPTEVNLGQWVKATFYNDGAGNVYVYNIRQVADTRDAYLAPGDSLPIDFRRRTIRRLYLVCAAGGTAKIRIFYQ